MADGVIGIKITGDATGLQQSLQGASGSVREFSEKIKDSAGSMDALANGLKSAFVGSSIAVGIIGLKNTVGEFTQALIQAQIQADKLRNGLNFAVGRSNSAGEIDFIRSSAKNLGLEFVSTAAQYTKLAAAARDTGLQGQKVRDVFTSIAQASMVMGLSAQETEGALLAVTQMISKGKVQAEELRGQLGERLPGAFQIAAEAMGVTTGELDKMLQTGNVLTEDFLPKFAAVLTRKTAPEVAAAAQSMQASVNLMANAWTDFKQTFADGAVASGLSGSMRGIATSVGGISENLQVVKANGGGFFRQFIQLTGDSLATFLPLVDAPRTLAVQLDMANQKVVSLQKSMTGADAYTRDFLQKEIASTQDWITVLAIAIAKKRELMTGPGGGNQSAAEDRRFSESASAESARKARIKAQQDGLKAAMGTYATPNENLTAELKKQKDLLGDLFTPDLERRIRAHFIKPVTDTSDAAKGLKLYSDLIGKSGGYSADYAEKVTYLSAAYAKGKISLTDLNTALVELNAEQKVNIGIAKDHADAQKAIIKAYEEEVKAHQDKIKELDRSATGEATRMQKLQDEEKAVGIAAEQQISLAAAIEEVGLARVRETYAKEAANNADGQTLLALQKEITAREGIIKLLGDKEVRTANAEAAKKAAEDTVAEWKKGWNETDRIGREVFTAWATDGSSAAKKIGDTLKTALLSAIYDATLKPIMFQIYASATGGPGVSGTAAFSGGAAVAESSLNALKGLGAMAAAFNGAGLAGFAQSGLGQSMGLSQTIATDAGPGLANTTAGNLVSQLPIGGIIAAYSKGGLEGFATGVASTAVAGAVAAGTTALAGGATAMAAGSAAMSGATAALAAVPGWGWAALGVAAFLGMNGNSVHGVGTGSAGKTFDKTGKIIDTQATAQFGGATAQTDAVISALQSSYITSAAKLGIGAVQTGFSTGSNISSDGTNPHFSIGSAAGSKSYQTADNTLYSADAMQLEASRAVLAALQGSELPKYLAGAFDGITVSTLTQAQIDEWYKGADAIKVFNDTMQASPWESLKNLSYQTIQTLALYGGGIDKVSASLGTFYDKFYTSAEKTTNLTKSTAKAFDALGIVMPAADSGMRDWYKTLVENQLALDQSIPGNAMVTNSILSLQGAVDTLAPAFDSVTASVNATADAITKAFDQLTTDSKTLAADLLRAQGNTRAADFLTMGVDPNNAAASKVVAQYDANQAIKGQIAAIATDKTAVDALNGVIGTLAGNRKTLESQVLTANGDPAGALALTRKNELAKLTEGMSTTDAAKVAAAYAYNTALEDQITALNNAKTAADAAAQAQQQAADAAAKAAEQLKSAWQSVTDSIFTEVQRIRGLMSTNGAQSFAQAQSAFYQTNAQAQSGNQDAAKLLPGLSQTLLTLAEAQATSLLQLRSIQGQVAGTLTTTGTQLSNQFGLTIPKLATGTNMVPKDMIAMIHAGEAVVPAVYNPANGAGAPNGDMVAELQAMRIMLQALQAAADKTADSSLSTSKMLTRVTRNGDAMQVTTDTSVTVIGV
jgi:tape measure domain-containing protein